MDEVNEPDTSIRRKGGRPLSFDRDAALERAMLMFWRHGYETTSISDLTREMRITAPSLYTAFGDKKRLFLEAVRLYAGEPMAGGGASEQASSALEAARMILIGAAIGFTGETTPPGCLLASATASGSAASADVQAHVAGIRAGVIEQLKARIEHDVALGILPDGTDAAALSGMVMAVMQGLSTLARDGMSRDALVAIVDASLKGWPARPPTGGNRRG